MASIHADITKIDHSNRVVQGYASTIRKDRDNQIVDGNFLQEFFPPWCDTYGNVRLMHQPIVVGKVVQRSDWDGKGFYVSVKVYDDDAWMKVENGLLSGLSVGIKNAKVIPDPEASGGRLISGEFIELSLVDIPANYDSDITIVKSATFDEGTATWLDSPDDGTPDPDTIVISLDWMSDDAGDDDIDVYKRYYSAKERRNMPKSDFGDEEHLAFPVESQSDLDNAARLIRHARNKDEVQRRLVEIAHRKHLELPKEWQQDATKTLDVSSGLQPYNLEGDKEDKSTVADNKETPEVVEKNTDADFAKAADVNAVRETLDGLVTSFTEIRALIESMASQSDPDKDGDIDNVNHPEAEAAEDAKGGEQVITATNDAPNAVQDFLDNALKTATADILAKVESLIDEKFNTVTKSTTADRDNAQALLDGVQDVVKTLDVDFKKFSERLETVEQSAAPAKGVTMVVEKFASTEVEGGVNEATALAEVTKTVRANYPNANPTLLNQRINEEMAKRQRGGNK